MASIRLQYVKSYIDRHGKARHYLRRAGHKSVALPGLPGSEEFMAAYSAALVLATPTARIEPGATRTKPGSVNAMIASYLASGDYAVLRDSSKAQYRRILDQLRAEFGDLGIARLETRHVMAMLQRRAQTPTVARFLLRILRELCNIAIKQGLRRDNPCIGLKVKHKTKGHPTWKPEHVAAFEAAYMLGTKERLALALMLNFAARVSDVVRIGPGNVRDNRLEFTQQKTDAHLVIPLLPQTQAALDAMGPSEHLVFLTNDRGAAFDADGFSKWFRRKCRAIGLTGLPPHGLRKTACVRLAHAGCTAPEIAAISGHRNLNQVQVYIAEAEQERLAENALAKLRAQKGA